MSAHQVLALLSACLQDAGVGLAARVAALAATSTVPTKIRTDFAFTAWKLSGTMQKATQPNVMARPVKWAPTVKQVNHRDATVIVEVGVEYFDADPIALQENITIAASALVQVLDGLRAYSDARNGTIVDVLDPIEWQFGEFTGPTSAGFLATITIEERSAQ